MEAPDSKLIGREDWLPHINPEGALRDEMFASFRDFFKGRTLAEWMVALKAADLQFGLRLHAGDADPPDPGLPDAGGAALAP